MEMRKTYELQLYSKVRDRFDRCFGKSLSDTITFDANLNVVKHVIYSEAFPDGYELPTVEILKKAREYSRLEWKMQEEKDDVDFREYEFEPELETA